jgi:hypothetical protein
MLRAVLGGVAAFALAVGGATAAAADPIEPNGSISGAVVSETDGTPIAGIAVHAETNGGLSQADATTDESGAYSLDGLLAGDYVVRFSSPDGAFLSEYWRDTRDPRSAERVTVAEGAAVTGIDAALGLGGTISGIVTRADDGTPVVGAVVTANGMDTGSWGSAFTDEAGNYTLTGLPADSYVVDFFADGTDLTREYWEDAVAFDAATPVELGSGAAVSGIDAALGSGGAIAGVVTRAVDGSPVEGAYVSALNANREIVAAVRTDSSGAYRLDGLANGSYVVRFGADDPTLASEFWEDVYAWPAATPIVVTSLETVADVDAALDPVGYISGTVTKAADGSPIFGSVTVSDIDQLDAQIVEIDSEGGYLVPVVPGRYFVQFHAYESGLIDEYWEDARTRESATAIDVASDEHVEAVDAQLESAALITGTVTLDSDEDREVLVEAWSGNQLVGYTYVDLQTGAYTLSLPAGTFILKASATFYNDRARGAPPLFYDGAATADLATPITAVAGEPVEGIDFTLLATTGPEPKPALTLAAGTIRAGGEITVSGAGFTPGEKLAFELHSDPIALGSLTADAGGVLTGTLRIPASAPAGRHTLVALSGSTVVASVALTVTAAPSTGGAADPADPLASTGGEFPGFAVMAAFGFVVLGVTLARRRRAQV